MFWERGRYEERKCCQENVFFSEDVRKRTICEGMFCKGGPIVKITFYDEGDFL